MSLRNYSIRGLHLSLKPAPAWTAILGFVLVSALATLGGAGSLIRLAFPVGAFLVSVFLYRRYPILYLGFTWWLWFLTPWVRRLIDLRAGFVDPSPVLLAPFLATIVTLATFLRHFPKLYRREGLPFVLCFLGVVYAVFIGFINSKYGFESDVVKAIYSGGFTVSSTTVVLRALDWLTPILFSFHLLTHWQEYPEYRQNMQRTFRWGVLVMGTYGVVQYLVAPEWDRLWLRSIFEGSLVFGRPEPMGFRLFSTMNSAAPFAQAMMVGLLLLLADQGILRFFGAGFGYLAFLLTLVRTAWGGWFLGLLIFSSSLKPKLQMRLIMTVLVVGILTFPLTTVEPFSEVINSRFNSISTVEEDTSFQARSATYNNIMSIIPYRPLGQGLGVPALDSAFLDLLAAMGWLGGIPFIGGLVLILFKLSQCLKLRFDPFLSATTAISISSFGMSLLNNLFAGIQGMLFWSFIGISLAGHKYYQYKLLTRFEK
jgi:hypothetical protein